MDDALSRIGRGGLERAAGKGQARYNNDMGRGIESLVTGHKSKKEVENQGIGMFHRATEYSGDLRQETC